MCPPGGNRLQGERSPPGVTRDSREKGLHQEVTGGSRNKMYPPGGHRRLQGERSPPEGHKRLQGERSPPGGHRRFSYTMY